jgi:hypothetical protein
VERLAVTGWEDDGLGGLGVAILGTAAGEGIGCWLRQATEACHEKVTAELQLPIFKQGDDLAQHLLEEKDTKAALLAYAERLRSAAGMVETLVKHADGLEIEQADTHFILVSGPGLVIHSLIEEGVLAPEPDSDDGQEDWRA